MESSPSRQCRVVDGAAMHASKLRPERPIDIPMKKSYITASSCVDLILVITRNIDSCHENINLWYFSSRFHRLNAETLRNNKDNFSSLNSGQCSDETNLSIFWCEKNRDMLGQIQVFVSAVGTKHFVVRNVFHFDLFIRTLFCLDIEPPFNTDKTFRSPMHGVR